MTRYSRITATVALIILHTKESSGFSPTATRYVDCNPVQRIPTTLSNSNRIIDIVDVVDDEPCLIGDNTVASCDAVNDAQSISTSTSIALPRGTQTKLSATTNLGKCICGAGSFALPHVFLKEGVIGGTLAMTICAFLAMNTMQSINKSRFLAVEDEPLMSPPTSYVELTKLALGERTSKVVFSLTLAASLGVCSTYIVFVGQTLASLSADAMSGNIVHIVAPNIDETTWEMITAATVFPLSLVRNYGVFAFTSALGVSAVLGGIFVTLAYGVIVDPGGGIMEALSAVSELQMWPDSFSDAFGGSFGTIAYLFCVNFLTFPIINSMKDARNDYDGAVSSAVAVIWTVNALFAIICLGFYGEETQDLVLQNLDNGPYLSALKILLCVDLLFTFPVVFSSGRQILENLLIDGNQKEEDEETFMSLAVSRTAVTGGAVAICYGLSQIGGFGVVGELYLRIERVLMRVDLFAWRSLFSKITCFIPCAHYLIFAFAHSHFIFASHICCSLVANLVGGVAQGTLAFIIPPAIAISLSRRSSGERSDLNELPQWLIGAFGAVVVSSVTYFTLVESLS